MEFDELLVTTKVDSLVRIVKEKGEIELGIAARLIGVEPDAVEEWAHILEEEGLIKINYHLTKAYISWVTPTAEEVEKEREAIVREKDNLVLEIDSLKGQAEPKEKEIESLRSDFTAMYKKLVPEIDALQAQVSAFSAIKGKGANKLSGGLGKMQEINGKIAGISENLSGLKSELDSIQAQLKSKSPAEEKFEGLEHMKGELSEFADRLKAADDKISSLQKSLPKEKFDESAVRKSLEPLKLELAELKRSNNIIRENMLSIKEAFDVLGQVDRSVGERAARLDALKKELEAALSSASSLKQKGSEISESVESELGKVGGFMKSVEFARSSLSKFPSQSSILSRLDEISRNEALLESKIAALEKNASSSAVPQISLGELAKLKAELDERRKLLSQEVSDLFASVEEESSTYSTFQKIKERVLGSIGEYAASIKKMEEEIKEAGEEAKSVSKELEAGMEKMRGKVDGAQLDKLIYATEQAEEKRKLLDDIAESLEALSAASESINRKLNLISKEAQILSIRSEGAVQQRSSISPAPSDGGNGSEPEVRQQLSLTKSEVVEFDKKREELRNLIKKLWEQS